MVRTIRFLGNLLLGAGFILIAIGALGILATKGFGEFAKLFNPFNVANFVVMVVTLAPGLALRAWADHIEKGERQ